MTQEYKSFMTEGYSIGAHAESLYSRGYKHYGTMGQGNKQVHIFTPSKGKVDHHMLLKHDGADPARHEGQPDLKKIKGMTEMVETTDVIAIQKARETKAQRQDRNVQEETPEENVKRMKLLARIRKNLDRQISGDDEDWPAKRRKVDSAREASRNAQMKKMNEANLEEGWLFGSRYKQIGNKYATHRVTVKHMPTNTKHTFDVTAPTDRHAFDHVDRHMHGGRRGNTLSLVKIQHLHEGKEVMEESEDLQELSKDTLRSYAGKAKKAYDSKYKELSKPDHTGPAWGDMKGRIKKFGDHVNKLSKRREGINRAKAKLGEDTMNEAVLDIRHAINHSDSQARHHARLFKKHSKTANDIANMRVFPDQAYDYAHHYEAAQHHAKEYKKRLGQLEAGKNAKNEDLQELSKKTLGSYVKKAHASGTEAARGHEQASNSDRSYDRAYGKRHLATVAKRRKGIDMATDKLTKEDTDLQELSRNTLHSYLARARGNRNAAANRRDVADEKWEKASRAHRDGTAKTAHTGDYQRQTMKIQSSVSKSADRTIEKRTKGIAAARSRLTKEDLDEGLVSKITNAAKNLNKMTKGSDQRFSDAREKASFDKAKGTDLSPRGRALRKIEKLQWSKQNPVKAPKPIVPMGKLPDKVWSADSDKPKPKRVTDDSLDQPMFRKPGSLSRRFKSEELEIRPGQKVLKEKPKRDPKTGRLAKSKTTQKVEDCIKMSGKKEKIDTEPSYNPLTTAGGGGTPNA